MAPLNIMDVGFLGSAGAGGELVILKAFPSTDADNFSDAGSAHSSEIDISSLKGASSASTIKSSSDCCATS